MELQRWSCSGSTLMPAADHRSRAGRRPHRFAESRLARWSTSVTVCCSDPPAISLTTPWCYGLPNDAIPHTATGDKVNRRYDAFRRRNSSHGCRYGIRHLKAPASPQEMLTLRGGAKAALTAAVPYYKTISSFRKNRSLPMTVNV
ncbi:hypothetical protein M8494_11805 [Serratia ureilytica]